MKTLFVVPYFYPKTGGLENYALNIALGLKKFYKHTIVIVTSNHIENEYKVENIKGLKIYRLPYWFKISNTPFNPFWEKDLEKIIMQEKPNLINGHTPVPFISDIAALVAKKHEIPFVLTYQNDLVKNNALLDSILFFYYKIMGERTLALSKKIIASSSYYAKRSPYLRMYSKKIIIIPPGVNLKKFEITQLNKNKYKMMKSKYKNKQVILFIGQLDRTHKHKGLSYLFKSLSIIKAHFPNCLLVIIGKGNYIDEYRKLSKKLLIDDNTLFKGFVSEEDLPYFYHLADVVALPSYSNSEGFGMVLIEAGACKKPVVASKVGGIPYVVNDNKTGFLVKPKDTNELANAIQKILLDKHLAKKLGKNGYKKVIKNFTWDKQISKTNLLFKNLL